MPYIDADSHVYEVEETWDYLPGKYRHRRPVPITVKREDAPYMGVDNSFWLVDGKAMQWTWGPGTVQIGCPLTSVHAGMKEFSIGNQSLMDVAARLADLDRAGVDIQVIYSTLLFAPMTDDDAFETALIVSYNRWIEERCAEAPDRLKWSAVLPLREPGEAVREIYRVREAGAVSLMCFGTVGERMLHGPEFDPVWAAAQEVDLPVAVHVGWPTGSLRQMCDEHSSSLNVSFTLPLLIGFYSFAGGGILDRFPKLRAIFLEGGCSWLPWYLERMDHYYPVAEFFRSSFGLEPITSVSPENFKDRIYLTSEADETLLPFVLDFLGEDNIMMSEDMPHLEAREGSGADLGARTDLTDAQKQKILWRNAAAFYGLELGRGARAAAE
ncbi:MAG: amidohydrolase family protein [Defluviicoccus sp.]|nr:amidohydrolase family protein [Defluviicoccus sp.]